MQRCEEIYIHTIHPYSVNSIHNIPLYIEKFFSPSLDIWQIIHFKLLFPIINFLLFIFLDIEYMKVLLYHVDAREMFSA